MPDYRSRARARYAVQAGHGWRGRIWLWWKMLTYDVADDEAVPECVRDRLWADRQW